MQTSEFSFIQLQSWIKSRHQKNFKHQKSAPSVNSASTYDQFTDEFKAKK
jgi:hypothetical protein